MPENYIGHIYITAYHPDDENNITEIYSVVEKYRTTVNVKDFTSMVDCWQDGSVSVHVNAYPCDIKVENRHGFITISDIRKS